jgi:hypothetical protein
MPRETPRPPTSLRHTFAMPPTPPSLRQIPDATTLDEVIDTIASIIDWSISVSSRLGYFAALYKRITIAVRQAIRDGAFDDGPRMERFDVAFANRYFDALNGYFHSGDFGKPTRSWQVTFDGASRPEPIIVQHMIAGVTTHIELDLGIVVPQITSGAQLSTLRHDFNTINAVLASQLNGIVASVGDLSPALADLYAVLADNEIFLINEAVRSMRDSAWRFATLLTLEPGFARPPTIWARDRQVAGQVEVTFDPPGLTGLIRTVIGAIAARESRDIVKNIQVLNAIASTPAPIQTTL